MLKKPCRCCLRMQLFGTTTKVIHEWNVVEILKKYSGGTYQENPGQIQWGFFGRVLNKCHERIADQFLRQTENEFIKSKWLKN